VCKFRFSPNGSNPTQLDSVSGYWDDVIIAFEKIDLPFAPFRLGLRLGEILVWVRFFGELL